VGAIRLLRRPVFVSTTSSGRSTAVDFRLRTGMDLEALGHSPGSRVTHLLPFLAGTAGTGTVVSVEDPALHRFDLAAFDGGRRPLWAASRAWPVWASTLGFHGARVLSLKNVLTDPVPGAPEETILVTAEREGRGGAFLVDALSGALRGTLFHRGAFTADGPGREAQPILRGPAGQGRRIVLTGRHGEGEAEPSPCFTVIDRDGRPLQHVLLPELAGTPRADVLAHSSRADWTPGREELTIGTRSGILFTFAVRDGAVDVASVRAELADVLGAPEPPSRAGEEARLAREVRQTPPDFPTGWRDR
jgi:hypothetical protein